MKLDMGPEMRYGKALFQLSNENESEGISSQVKSFLNVLQGNVELSVLLQSQEFSNKEKKAVLEGVLKASEMFKNFICLMCDKGRAAFIQDALSWFEIYEKSALGVVNAYVKSAAELSKGQREKIESFVKNKAQGAKSVELEEEIDPSLVAGLRVRIGSIEYDMSVRGRLDDLRTSLN
jgi:F-type H+-transporting ATPase subunit delta